MSKTKTQYTCQICGSIHPKWTGQCTDCEAWNTLTEVAMVPSAQKGRFQGYAGEQTAQVYALPDVPTTSVARTSTGISELDRVLGGGLVNGSVILIGGIPALGSLLCYCKRWRRYLIRAKRFTSRVKSR